MNGAKHSVFLIISWATIVTAFLLLGLVGYWLFRPYNIIEYESFVVEQERVQAGQTVTYVVEACKHMTIAGQTIVDIENDAFVTLFSRETSLTAKCPVTVHKEVTIPSHFHAGEYKLRLIAIYEPNPLRTVRFEVESNPFVVF